MTRTCADCKYHECNLGCFNCKRCKCYCSLLDMYKKCWDTRCSQYKFDKAFHNKEEVTE